MIELPPRPPWMLHAACRGLDPNLFHPRRGERGADQARAVCARCPVQPDCLNHALDNGETLGTWGGIPEHKRRPLRRQRRQQQAEAS